MCTHACLCMTYANVCECVYGYVCICVGMYIYVCVYVYVYMFVYVCICMCVYRCLWCIEVLDLITQIMYICAHVYV